MKIWQRGISLSLGLMLGGVSALAPLPAVVAQTAANKADEAVRLVQEGVALYKQGKKQEAVNLLEQALVILKERKDRQGEATILGVVAAMQSELGQQAKALESLQRALLIHRELKDRKGEAQTLFRIGVLHDRLGQPSQALAALQQALPIYKELGDRKGEAQTLKNIGETYNNGQYSKALEFFQQALVITKEIGDRKGEGTALNTIGVIYTNLGQYVKALEFYQQALVIHREIGDRSGESNSLNNIGSIYNSLGQYSRALEFYQRALGIAKEIRNRKGEGTTLNNIGVIYTNLGQYVKALELYQQALVIHREIGDRKVESNTLNNIGGTYNSLGQYSKALDFHQQALVICREIGNRAGEGVALSSIGSVYNALSQYTKALDYHQQSLAISKEIGDRSGESVSLNNIGRVYEQLGQYAKALDYHQQSLAISKEIGDRSGESTSLNNIGLVYDALSQYAKALDYHQQSLAISKEIGARSDESNSLNNIGLVYMKLGLYTKALDYLQQSLAISKEIGNRFGESAALTNTGSVYRRLEKNSEALSYYQQALVIDQEIGSRWGEGFSRDYIGAVYRQMGEYAKALDYHQHSLVIRQELGNQRGEGIALDNLGQVYRGLGQYAQALDFFQRAFAVRQTIGDRQGEGETLSNLASVFKAQEQLELAIAFYKQSVNTFEAVRGEIRQLPREFQESYTQSLVGTYRNLADLLIQQGRLSEAQAVLELLKLRELREFTRDAGINSSGISLAKVEEAALNQILSQFTTVGHFTQELTKCQQTQCPNLRQLEQQRDALYAAVNQEMRQQRAILAKHFSSEAGTLSPDKLNAEARRIVNAQPGTVLIYPLVLKDKIQFLVAFQAGNGAVTFRPFETQVSAEHLFKTIQTFRQQLGETNAAGRPKADLAAVKATSQQLYTWLIKPLETELNTPAIKHLVFAPDSTTRYIPLAALYDGKQYLIQRFTISTITAASQTNTTARMPKPDGQQSLLLAMGASTFPNLNSLDNVPAELDAITKTGSSGDQEGIYPGSKFLNSTFDYEALKSSLGKGTYRILHLATHGAFKPGRPEDSYLVPGRGQNLTTELIDQLGNHGLGDIHLVVLSACETAVGDRASDGIEIPGISYFFLKNEVKSVMASLWNVNDASTALIMQQFYKHVATGKTKAEALQAVQQDLIRVKLTAQDAPARADVIVTAKPGRRTAQGVKSDFSHPYYWAPFILIGNSL